MAYPQPIKFILFCLGFSLHVLLLLFAVVIINPTQVFSYLFIRPFSPYFDRCVGDYWMAWFMVRFIWVLEKVGCSTFSHHGDTLHGHENYFVMANHAYWCDPSFLYALAGTHGRMGQNKVFIKKAISYVPGLGWGAAMANLVPISRNWDQDKVKVEAALGRLKKVAEVPFRICSFLEGTRFNLSKWKQSMEWARANNLPPLRHIMYPRPRGFTASIQNLRNNLHAVVDVTLAYDRRFPQPMDCYSGSQATHILAYVRRFDINSVPTDPAEIRQWLVKRYIEKDNLLEFARAYGRFPETKEEKEKVEQWNRFVFADEDFGVETKDLKYSGVYDMTSVVRQEMRAYDFKKMFAPAVAVSPALSLSESAQFVQAEQPKEEEQVEFHGSSSDSSSPSANVLEEEYLQSQDEQQSEKAKKVAKRTRMRKD